MREVVLALGLAFCVGCGASAVERFDNVAGAYDALSESAMAYAETPGVPTAHADVITEAVLRSTPLVVEARGRIIAECADQPVRECEVSDKTALYLDIARSALREAIRQISNVYLLKDQEVDALIEGMADPAFFFSEPVEYALAQAHGGEV